jgi:hypothetical protein
MSTPVSLPRLARFWVPALSHQDVAIATLDKGSHQIRPVLRFAALLGILSTLLLAVVAWTPLSRVWFETVSGLRPDLAAYAIWPVRILTLMPALSVLLNLERAVLVHGRRTGLRPATAEFCPSRGTPPNRHERDGRVSPGNADGPGERQALGGRVGIHGGFAPVPINRLWRKEPASVLLVFFVILLCTGLSDGQETTDPAGGVAGLVTRHGFPVPARVELRRMPTGEQLDAPPAAPGPPLAVVSAARDGSYRFDHLAPGRYELRAISESAVCFETFEIEKRGERCSLGLSLAPVGELVAGRARWSDGTPFPGIVSSRTAVVATDGDGAFSLTTRVGSGRRIVVFQERRIRRELIVPDDGQVIVDADLVSGAGTVLTAMGGVPLPGATVSARGYQAKSGWTHTATEADAKGHFKLQVAPEEPLTAGAPGYLPQIIGPAGPFEFRLERAPVVEGKVVSVIDQRPVAGVPVILLHLVRSNIETGDFMCAPTARAMTDSEGRFRIESPVAGDVMVFAFGQGWITPELALATNSGFNPAAISLSPGEHRALEVAATRSPSIAGRVVDPDGKGMSGVPVFASIEPGGSNAEQWHMGEYVGLARTVTGPDGRYRFATLIPGIDFEITAYPAARPSPEPVTIQPEGTVEITLDLVLPPKPPQRFVEILVLAKEDGSPVSDAEVRVESENGLDGDIRSETTGPDGKARLGPLTRRPLLASVAHPAFSPRRDLPLCSEDLTLKIELARRQVPAEVARPPVPRVPPPPETPDGGTSFVDVVIRSDDGKPVASGVILVQTLTLGYQHRMAVRKGETIRFTGGQARLVFAERDWLVWLDVRPDGDFAPALVGPVGWKRNQFVIEAEPVAWADSPVEIEVGPPGDIEGRVVGPDGVGVRGARVFAFAVNSALLERGASPAHHGAAYCDGTGRFRIAGLGDGEYLLRVAGPPTLLEPGPVIGRGNRDIVEIRLATAVAPTITVLDPEGKPLEDVRVRVHLPDESRPPTWSNALQTGRTDSDGITRLARLDPEERYTLVLHPGYDRPEIDTLEVTDWKPGDGTFRLPTARVLRGIVRDRDGFPISRATVWYQVPGEDGMAGKWKKIRAREDGRFSIDEIPRRPIRLTAHPEWRSRRLVSDQMVEVGADEDNAELRIDGGPIYLVRVVGWPENAEAKACVGWAKDQATEYGSWPLSPDGRLRLHCFGPGGKAVFWIGLPGGLMAYGELQPDVENILALRPGKSIEGEIVMPEGARVEKLMVYGEYFTFEAPVDPGGRFKIWSLPEGTYQLFVRAKLGSAWFGDDAEVEAGSTVKIVLKPEK